MRYHRLPYRRAAAAVASTSATTFTTRTIPLQRVAPGYLEVYDEATDTLFFACEGDPPKARVKCPCCAQGHPLLCEQDPAHHAYLFKAACPATKTQAQLALEVDDVVAARSLEGLYGAVADDLAFRLRNPHPRTQPSAPAEPVPPSKSTGHQIRTSVARMLEHIEWPTWTRQERQRRARIRRAHGYEA